MGLSTAPAPEIRSSVDHVAAGAAIGGRVVGFAGSVNVVLVRRERSPAREHLAECASVTLRGPRVEQFRLDVPPDLPPTASSRRCAIDYWLAANEALGDGRLARAAVTVAATAAPHVEARGVARDRMLAHSAARRFHLELSVADLCGGGRIRGRVHRHGAGP